MINVTCGVFNPSDKMKCTSIVQSYVDYDRRVVVIQILDKNGQIAAETEVFGDDMIQAIENCMQTGVRRFGLRGYRPDYTNIREDE